LACKVKLREGETTDSLLARFKTQVKKSGILTECRKREFFLKKSLKRKRKSEEARKLARQKGRK
jgi:small subunit ribosomal protein S21